MTVQAILPRHIHETETLLHLLHTTKGGSRQLEKSHKFWMMMIAAGLMWAGAGEMCERFKVALNE